MGRGLSFSSEAPLIGWVRDVAVTLTLWGANRPLIEGVPLNFAALHDALILFKERLAAHAVIPAILVESLVARRGDGGSLWKDRDSVCAIILAAVMYVGCVGLVGQSWAGDESKGEKDMFHNSSSLDQSVSSENHFSSFEAYAGKVNLSYAGLVLPVVAPSLPKWHQPARVPFNSPRRPKGLYRAAKRLALAGVKTQVGSVSFGINAPSAFLGVVAGLERVGQKQCKNYGFHGTPPFEGTC
jgi:hypothetical protein